MEDLRLFDLLAPWEIAQLMRDDPTWELPHGSQQRWLRIGAARALVAAVAGEWKGLRRVRRERVRRESEAA